MTADVTPTISALQRRGDQVVEHLLRENESRWESPSQADRDRLETLAHSVATRLLHEPALRLESSSPETCLQYEHALRELFCLGSAGEEPTQFVGRVAAAQPA